MNQRLILCDYVIYFTFMESMKLIITKSSYKITHYEGLLKFSTICLIKNQISENHTATCYMIILVSLSMPVSLSTLVSHSTLVKLSV